MTLRPAPEGSRRTRRGLIVSLYPDYCHTGNGICPFMIHAFQDEDAGTAATVRMTGERVHTSGSLIMQCHGDEAGVGGGVNSGTYMGACRPRTWSRTVRVEGKNIIRHSDEWDMNGGNTVGKLNWVEDSGLYGPTPPFAAAQDGAPDVLLASGSMADKAGAAEDEVMPAASVVGVAGVSSSSSQSGVKAFLSYLWEKAGHFRSGRFAPYKGVNMLLFLEQQDRQALKRMEALRERLQLASRLVEPVRSGAVSVPGFVADTGFFASDITSANRLLTHMNAGRPLTVDDIRADEVEAILAGWKAVTPAEPAAWDKTREKAGVHALAEGAVRVTSRCKRIQVCFTAGGNGVNKLEFLRQLKLQERGLNRLTPFEYQFNRESFKADSEGLRRASKPLQDRTREEYKTLKKKIFKALYGKSWEAELNRHVATLDALHSPDMIAGGYYTSVADKSVPVEERMGGRSENRSIGAQWLGRVARLDVHAAWQIANRCISLNATLEICASYASDPGAPVPAQSGVPF